MPWPAPAMEVPVIFPEPLGSLKYPPTAFLTCSLLDSNHSTMKSAIIAVTKSA